MKRAVRDAVPWILVVLGLLACAGGCAVTAPADGDWPQFRGPGAAGIGDGLDAPLSWDVEKGEGVRWRTPIPGLGHASPVVLGERVYIVTAVSGDPETPLRVGLYGDIAPVDDPSVHSFRLYVLERASGKVLAATTICESVPRIKRHPKASHASSTPAAGGKRLVVFLGSEGLYGFDLEGKLVWKRDLGVLDSGYYLAPAAQWGFASSPVIWRDRVIVQCDVQKGSFLAAFALDDGRELWRAPRDEVPTWGTPTVVEAVTSGGGGARRAEVVVNGHRHAGGYDPATGKELWRMKGGGDIPVPTPVAAGGLVFLTNAHGGTQPLWAVRLGAEGDISLEGDVLENRSVAWYLGRAGVYLQTPIVYRDHLYLCRGSGVLACYEAASGKEVYEKRLGPGRTGFTSSPVAADGRIYFASEDGDVYVVRAGAEFELLATNPLAEVCMATPAVTRGILIFRTRGHVVAVGGPGKGAKS
jgi:outer membrane protein assembly factor BamB